MALSHSLRLAALLALVHSFTNVSAELTKAPTPTATIAPRGAVAGAPGTPILSTLKYDYTALPYQVYPFQVLRGPQFGFNQCNSTTLGDNSNCQTLIFNGPDDFCLWGSPDAKGAIGDVEAKVVAYCTKPYHGTRVIPQGSITGLQWIKTPGYIQVSGFIKNGGIGLSDTDMGGELDPHGADLQGNPLGGVVYSNGTTDSDGHTLTQVMNWNTFVGSGQFCFKACYNSITSPDYCENRYDLVGCAYNMPSAAKDGEFTSCEGDVQDVVGVYTANGVVSTWSMPEPLTTTPPYQPRVPASRNCKTFQSSELFAFAGASTLSGAAATTTSGSTLATVTGSATGTKSTGTGTVATSGGSSSSGATPAPTKSSGAIGGKAPTALLALAAGAAAFLL